MATRKKVSPAQLRALQDTRDHGNPWYSIYGQSAHGGMHGTMMVISVHNKWVWHNGKTWVLTKEGKKVLKEAERNGW
jgi:hypothetical protein